MQFTDTWVEVPAPPECMCADGSPYSFLVREADPTKVAIVLGGGTICFSEPTCKKITREQMSNTYFWGNVGMFDFTNSANPFANYSIVFVPQCTLDQFLGNAPATYPLVGEIFQVGNINATAAVEWAADRFSEAQLAVIVGTSTGGSATTNMAGLIAKELPGATVKMIVDSAGELNTLNYEAFAQSNPDVRLARIYFANDTARNDNFRIGLEPLDGPKNILDGEQRIEAAGRPISTWMHPGGYHTPLNEALFYEMEQNGVSLTDWLRDFLAGVEVPDQLCTVCDQ